MCFDEEVNQSMVNATDVLVTYNREYIVSNFQGRHTSENLPKLRAHESEREADWHSGHLSANW